MSSSSAPSPAAVDPAQAIALSLRDFITPRVASEDAVAPFLAQVGGFPTLFALIAAIEDSLHLGLLKKVLRRLFEETPNGRDRLCSEEVKAYLLQGLSPYAPKHARLLSLQQAHLFVQDARGLARLMEPDVFNTLLQLLRDEDVEITEEIVRLLRKVASTAAGSDRHLHTDTLRVLFGLVVEGATPEAEKKVQVIDVSANDSRVVQPFVQLLRQQQSAAVSASAAPAIDSIVLLRVLTLLTQVACGTKLPGDKEGPRVFADAALSPEQITARSWERFSQFGLFQLLLELSSISAEDGKHDMLLQLNGLELIEEVVTNCPQLNDAFAVQLTKEILDRAADQIRRKAAQQASLSTGSIIPTSSFITVAVLRVFNRLAAVSAAKNVHAWYREPSFLLFLSAAFSNYDDEGVQTEAIDLMTTLGSFAQGIQFFATVESSLPAAVAPSQASAYLSNPYASAVTPILLYQVPFFVHGSSYSNGLRQLSALHGMAKMLMALEVKAEDAAASAADAASPTQLLCRCYEHIQKFNSNKNSSLDVLLLLAKQPFEDVREAVWKLVLGLTKHAWGVRALAQTAGCPEYLLDRKTEFHVSGMRAKFDIIKSLAASPFAAQCMTETGLKQVQEYSRQGAHYAPLTVGVMGPVSGTGQ